MMENRALDIEDPKALLAYLRQKNHVGLQENPAIEVLAGGVSNRTVRVARANGDTWVLKQALERLRVPTEWRSSPERIHREALGMVWLAKLAPPGAITRLIFEDFEEHLIAMEAVPLPHENWKNRLLAGKVEGQNARQFGVLLGAIHRHASERQAELPIQFQDRSYFESLRLEPYYQYTAIQVPEAASFLDRLVADTVASQITLTHGDYSPKNILLHQDRLVLLDHEVIHLGDGAFDIGFSLTHLLSKARHLPTHRRAFIEAAQIYWRAYLETVSPSRWGPNYEARAVRHTLACLLARVAGRSCLEYLDAAERAQQRQAVVNLMRAPPDSIMDLILEFTEYASH